MKRLASILRSNQV